ncbi:MAG: hypothetical protein ACK4GN_13700 [Runella sp.]
MKNLLHIFVLSLAVSISWGQSTPTQNFVVLLDLSDRLLASDQAARDQQLILKVFEQFERAVRKNLFINSQDAFRVVIAPQKGLERVGWEDQLQLNMAGVKVSQKRLQFDGFKKSLPQALLQLYAEAKKGKTRSSDFPGCDIWQYFNEALLGELIPNAQNNLVVITDGYFDFETNTHGLSRNGRDTDTHKLMRYLRGKSDWQQLLAHPNTGLLPVAKKFPANTRVAVVELTAKYDHLDELDILAAIWKKWLLEMNLQPVQMLNRSSLQTEKAKLGHVF